MQESPASILDTIQSIQCKSDWSRTLYKIRLREPHEPVSIAVCECPLCFRHHSGVTTGVWVYEPLAVELRTKCNHCETFVFFSYSDPVIEKVPDCYVCGHPMLERQPKKVKKPAMTVTWRDEWNPVVMGKHERPGP
jgi:hypothetical protein